MNVGASTDIRKINRFPNLLSPFKVGNHIYKNRIIGAPMYCGTFATIPFLSSVLFQSVEEKAKGGCAQVTIGETPVDFEFANREPFEPIDYADYTSRSFKELKRATEIIQSYGAVALIELSHCGESKLVLPGLKNPIGPMGYVRQDGVEVLALDEAMMESVCASFITSAKFMQAAGFDGVVIHAGHGWLLHQFLSARTNQRTDGYGGSLENRAKFPLQVLRRVREAMGKDFIIEVRVSGEECEENGMGIEETGQFCRMIESMADIIHVSIGTYRNPILSGEFSSVFQPHGLNAGYAELIKLAVSIPVTVVGGINTPELAELLIAEGKCDFVALARQLTADPAFANKAAAGKETDIVPCVRCFKCFPGPLEDNLDDLSKLFGCTVNPEAFYFDESVLKSKPAGVRKVLVVGGGIAGMEAAITAADRRHQVTLVEKAAGLGGLLKFADADVYKRDLGVFKDVMVRRVQERDIKVILGQEFTPADVASFGAEAVILAVGSSPVVPPIPGIESAMKAVDVYDNLSKIGPKVVMVGGGLIGCEVGLHLAQSGRDVTVIEMLDQVAPDAYPMHRIGLLHEMDNLLTYRTGLKCTSITQDGVLTVDQTNNERFFVADTVIYAVGMFANRHEVEQLRKAVQDIPVYEIGDCVQAGKVYEAVRQGFIAAMSIL